MIQKHDEHEKDIHSHSHSHKHDDCESTAWPFIFVAAISVHSFIEGFALGLSTSKSDIFVYFLAIFLHKWALALAIGMSFVTESINMMVSVSCLTIFSLASPCGILVGALAEGISNKVAALMNAAAAGTFIYIGLVEMLSEEMHNPYKIKTKVVLMVLGALLMVGLYFVEYLV